MRHLDHLTFNNNYIPTNRIELWWICSKETTMTLIIVVSDNQNYPPVSLAKLNQFAPKHGFQNHSRKCYQS